MKFHALFVIFEKSSEIWICCLLQIIGGALWVKSFVVIYLFTEDIPVKRSKLEDEEDRKQDYEDWKRKILENAARAQASGTSWQPLTLD